MRVIDADNVLQGRKAVAERKNYKRVHKANEAAGSSGSYLHREKPLGSSRDRVRCI